MKFRKVSKFPKTPPTRRSLPRTFYPEAVRAPSPCSSFRASTTPAPGWGWTPGTPPVRDSSMESSTATSRLSRLMVCGGFTGDFGSPALVSLSTGVLSELSGNIFLIFWYFRGLYFGLYDTIKPMGKFEYMFITEAWHHSLNVTNWNYLQSSHRTRNGSTPSY